MDYIAALREAKAEYDEWERRAPLLEAGPPGWFKVLAALVPLCYCGRRAVRRGLCERHRHEGNPPCTRCGKRPSVAKGLCNPCYTTAQRQRDPSYGRGARWKGCGKGQHRRSGRATECHPDRPHKAHGLCKPCYKRWIRQQHQRRARAAYKSAVTRM